MQLQLVSAQSAELQQLALNIEKLAQLKQVLANMKQGYQLIFTGYSRIKDITEGNFNLHDAFLNGLLQVSPEIARFSKAADIILTQRSLISEYKAAFGQFKAGGRFSPDEIQYLGNVYSNLLKRSEQQLDELNMILTSGRLRMSDDERLQAVNRIYEDMQDKITFLRDFNRRAAMLEYQREKDQQAQQTLRQINGLK